MEMGRITGFHSARSTSERREIQGHRDENQRIRKKPPAPARRTLKLTMKVVDI
jgi:hypothetical protein